MKKTKLEKIFTPELFEIASCDIVSKNNSLGHYKNDYFEYMHNTTTLVPFNSILVLDKNSDKVVKIIYLGYGNDGTEDDENAHMIRVEGYNYNQFYFIDFYQLLKEYDCYQIIKVD